LNLPLLRKLLIIFWSHWNSLAEKNAVRTSKIVFAHGRLFDKYKRIMSNIVETNLSAAILFDDREFVESIDKMRGPPYRLLFLGRVVRDKGLFELVDALSLLRRQGVDVLLDIVGDAASPVELELRDLVREERLEPYVKLHGFKTFGRNYSNSTDAPMCACFRHITRTFPAASGKQWRTAYRSLRRRLAQFRTTSKILKMLC
jgi:glycosyltransferase involved in cell wall biosynthesis